MRCLFALLCAAVVAVPALAGAEPGVLSRTEICMGDGHYASLGDVVSLAGGNEVLVVAAGEGGAPVVHRFNSSGQPIGELQLPPPLQDVSADFLRLDRGPPGRIYVTNTANPAVYDVQLSGSTATIRHQLYKDDFYQSPFTAPVGVLASPTGQSFVYDRGWINAYDLETDELQYGGDATVPGASASETKAVAVTLGALAVGKTYNGGRDSDQIAYFRNSKDQKKIVYAGLTIDVPAPLEDISGTQNGGIWVATYNKGLYRVAFDGKALDIVGDLVPIYHVDTPADGIAWVVRDDGLYRIGPGGTKVERSAYRAASRTCGPARLTTAVAPRQDIAASGRLVLRVTPSELVNARISGALVAGRTYRLKGTTKRIPAGRRANLPLVFSRSALGALKRMIEAGHEAQIAVHIDATDVTGQIRAEDRVLRVSGQR
jgi:hypothetical protein